MDRQVDKHTEYRRREKYIDRYIDRKILIQINKYIQKQTNQRFANRRIKDGQTLQTDRDYNLFCDLKKDEPGQFS